MEQFQIEKADDELFGANTFFLLSLNTNKVLQCTANGAADTINTNRSSHEALVIEPCKSDTAKMHMEINNKKSNLKSMDYTFC